MRKGLLLVCNLEICYRFVTLSISFHTSTPSYGKRNIVPLAYPFFRCRLIERKNMAHLEANRLTHNCAYLKVKTSFKLGAYKSSSTHRACRRRP